MATTAKTIKRMVRSNLDITTGLKQASKGVVHCFASLGICRFK